MIKEFGSKAEDMKAYMGPAISKKNFEVDKDVADMFDKKYVEAKTGKSGKTGTAGKFVVDTGKIVYDSLINTGVMPGNIESYPLCTYDETETLHSYRRDRNLSGRMFAVIGMK
jgi:copper oxidase (laccase) domain-containing protein